MVLGVLLIGAGTKRFGRLWVFGWSYDAKDREATEWKTIALRLLGVTDQLAEAGKSHTTFTPAEAEIAKRIVREAGRNGPGNDERA